MRWSSLNFVCITLVFLSVSHGKITLHDIFNWGEDDECFETHGAVYNGLTCPELVDEALGYCYTAIYDQCCISCNLKRSRFPNCKFGDSSMECRVNQCHLYDSETKDICCETCRNYKQLGTLPPTTTPSPTAPVVAQSEVNPGQQTISAGSQTEANNIIKKKQILQKSNTITQSSKIVTKTAPTFNANPSKGIQSVKAKSQVTKIIQNKVTKLPHKSEPGTPTPLSKSSTKSSKSIPRVHGLLNMLSGPSYRQNTVKTVVKVKTPSTQAHTPKTKPSVVKKKKILKTKKPLPTNLGSSGVHFKTKPHVAKKNLNVNKVKPVHINGIKDYKFNYVKDPSIKPLLQIPSKKIPHVMKKQATNVGSSLSHIASKVPHNGTPSKKLSKVLKKQVTTVGNHVPIIDRKFPNNGKTPQSTIPAPMDIIQHGHIDRTFPNHGKKPASTISAPMDIIQHGQPPPHYSSPLTSDWTDPIFGAQSESPWIGQRTFEKTMTLSAPQMSIPDQLKNTVLSMPKILQDPDMNAGLLGTTIKQSKQGTGPSDVVATGSGSPIVSKNIPSKINKISKSSPIPKTVVTKSKTPMKIVPKKIKSHSASNVPLPDPIKEIKKTKFTEPKKIENIWDSNFPFPDPAAGVHVPTTVKQSANIIKNKAPKEKIVPHETIVRLQAGHQYDENLFKHAIQKAAIQAVLEHAGSSILSKHSDPTPVVGHASSASFSKHRSPVPALEHAGSSILSKQGNLVPTKVVKDVPKQIKNIVQKHVNSVKKEVSPVGMNNKKSSHIDQAIAKKKAKEPTKKLIIKKPALPDKSIIGKVNTPSLHATPLVKSVTPKIPKVKHFLSKTKDTISQVKQVIKSHPGAVVKQNIKKVVHAPEVKKLLHTLTGTQGKLKTVVRKIKPAFDPYALPPFLESAIVGDLPKISLKESVLNVPEEALHISKQQRHMVNVPINLLGETHIPLSMDLSKFSVPRKSPEVKIGNVPKIVQKPQKINKVIKPDIKSTNNIKVLPKTASPQQTVSSPHQLIENVKTIEHTFHVRRVPRVRKGPTVQGRGPVTTMQRANVNVQPVQQIARPVTFLPPSFMTPIIQNFGLQQANALFAQPVLVKRTHEFRVVRGPASRRASTTGHHAAPKRNNINTGPVTRHQPARATSQSSFNSIHPPIRQNHNIQNSFNRNNNPSPFVRTVRRQNMQFSRQFNNLGSSNTPTHGSRHTSNHNTRRGQNPNSWRLNNLSNVFTQGHGTAPTSSIELPPIVVHQAVRHRTTFMQPSSFNKQRSWPYNFYRM